MILELYTNKCFSVQVLKFKINKTWIPLVGKTILDELFENICQGISGEKLMTIVTTYKGKKKLNHNIFFVPD